MKSYPKVMKIRFFLLFCIMTLCFLILIGSLIKIQAYEHQKYRKMAVNQQVGQIELNALRGAIFDRNGSALAFSVSHPSIAVNPKMVTNHDRTAFYLALLLNKKKKDILPILTRQSTFEWIARKVDEKTANQIDKMKLPGVFLINESSGKRYYPKQRIACHVLGYTGIDDQGLEGTEANYDKILAGKQGLMRTVMDQRGRILPLGRIEGASQLTESDIKDPAHLAARFKYAKDPLSKYLKEKFSPETKQLLNEYSGFGAPSEAMVTALTNELNKIIRGPCIYEKKRFGKIVPSQILLTLIEQDRDPEDVASINRLLLEEAYPDEIAECHQIYIPSIPGKNIYLTIDETLQFIVEKELEKAVKKHQAAGGTIIVYDPRTGDILALANYPTYLPSRGIMTDKKIVRNKAVCDNYEPGSTFKTILVASALDSGKVSITDKFYCGSSLEVGGYSLRNANDGLSSETGYETLEGMLTYSFNVGAASIGLRLGSKLFSRYCFAMGFGKKTGVDLPGETEGILAPGEEWKPINLATIAYGQGVSVTPIQMVQAYGAIANEGVMMKPRIVRKITDIDGNVVKVIKPKVAGKPLKPKTCHEVLKMLRNVCVEGTGKGALIKGYDVGGKTGTANVVENGVYVSGKYIPSFIGIAPIDDPKVVILVKIDEPKGVIWGGAVAAPVFNKVGSQIFWRLGIQSKLDSQSADFTPPLPEKEEVIKD